MYFLIYMNLYFFLYTGKIIKIQVLRIGDLPAGVVTKKQMILLNILGKYLCFY